MLNLDAAIIPGVGAAGIAIGQPIEAVLRLGPPDGIEDRITLGIFFCRVLKYGPVWVFHTTEVVDQICVFEGYRGKIADLIGIGSRITDVEAAFGSVENIQQDEYQVAGPPPGMSANWCFEVEKGSPSMGEPGWLDARLCCICAMED